jgi:hypothetical protein
MLGVRCADRDDCGGDAGERFQQVAHCGDLVGLRVLGQVRRLPAFVLRAADGLAVDRDHQPAAGPHGPGVQPGAEGPAGHISADQGESSAEG